MILLDKPYVSDYLQDTIIAYRFPVIETESLESLGLGGEMRLCKTDEAIRAITSGDAPRLYANSENAIDWIEANLAITDLPRKIRLFKDKVAFRDLLKDHLPGFTYRSVSLQALETIDASELRLPCVIKPAVGFFSMGVHKVSDTDDWPHVVAAIHEEMRAVQALYPQTVLDPGRFIIEDCIEGDEFAIDVYWDDAGEPVILNILMHLFASAQDVSDRVYITSQAIIRRYHARFQPLLRALGELASLRNFPAHVEARIDDAGTVIPVEVNPMRFGGWCAVDLAHFAYDINPYGCYLRGARPNWDEILSARDDAIYALVVLDMSPDSRPQQIERFAYEAVLAQFERPLELRKIDYREYPVFGFVITQTRPDNMVELETILKSDLKAFIQPRGILESIA